MKLVRDTDWSISRAAPLRAGRARRGVRADRLYLSRRAVRPGAHSDSHERFGRAHRTVRRGPRPVRRPVRGGRQRPGGHRVFHQRQAAGADRARAFQTVLARAPAAHDAGPRVRACAAARAAVGAKGGAERTAPVLAANVAAVKHQTDWMEWQAGYVSGALLMPRSRVKLLVDAFLNDAEREVAAGSGIGRCLRTQATHERGFRRFARGRRRAAAQTGSSERLAPSHRLPVRFWETAGLK